MSENTFENVEQDVNVVEETDLEQVELERAADEGGMVPPSVSHEAGDKDTEQVSVEQVAAAGEDPAIAPVDPVTGDASPAVDEAINVDMPEQPTRDERGEGL